MHRTILTAVLSVLVFSVCLSSTSRISVASAAIGHEQPVSWSQVGAGVEGNWLGALDVGGFKLRLVLKISKSADGKLNATVDSLDQNAKDLAVDMITFQDGTLKF